MAVLLLKRPLTLGKAVVEKLTFRDHTTAADYLSFDKRGGVAQRIALIASMAGTDESLIMQLSGRDYLAAEKIVDELMAADGADEAAGVVEDATEKK